VAGTAVATPIAAAEVPLVVGAATERMQAQRRILQPQRKRRQPGLKLDKPAKPVLVKLEDRVPVEAAVVEAAA
jgi:hypothetical protein